MRSIRYFIALLAVSALVAPASALAQSDPSRDAYGDFGPQVQEQIDQGGPTGGPTNESGGPTRAAERSGGSDEGGSLPFTGFELALIVGAGALLLGTGFALRRITRAGQPA